MLAVPWENDTPSFWEEPNFCCAQVLVSFLVSGNQRDAPMAVNNGNRDINRVRKGFNIYQRTCPFWFGQWILLGANCGKLGTPRLNIDGESLTVLSFHRLHSWDSQTLYPTILYSGELVIKLPGFLEHRTAAFWHFSTGNHQPCGPDKHPSQTFNIFSAVLIKF